MKINCDHCGVEVNKPPCEIRERNYCSQKCSALAKRKYLSLKCGQCGKTFTRRSRGRLSTKGKRQFCSRECQYQYQSQPRSEHIKLKCAKCGKSFTRTPSNHRKNGKTGNYYCSRECSRTQEYVRSSIELQLEGFLKQWGFSFTPQQRFDTPPDYHDGEFHGYVDFYFPEFHLVIECNGTYWHGDPEKYSPDELNDVQLECVSRYERKKRYLHSRGVKLLEIWERDNDCAEDYLLGILILLSSCKAVAEVGKQIPAVA